MARARSAAGVRFGAVTPGSLSQSQMIWDAAGNLYGTTLWGGAPDTCGCGTVFQLKPNGDGTWTESVLHNFSADEANPWAGLVFDAAGNLYGTTGNPYVQETVSDDVVFKLTPNTDGTWTESVLHRFAPNSYPSSPLIFVSVRAVPC